MALLWAQEILCLGVAATVRAIYEFRKILLFLSASSP